MRVRLPKLDSLLAERVAERAAALEQAAQKPLAREVTRTGRPEWAVPAGVRTASEWSWRAIIIALAVWGALYLLTTVSEVVIPIIVGLLLSALLHPVYRLLARVMPKGAAAGLTVLGTLALLIGMLSFVGSQFSTQFDDITTHVGQGINQVREWVRTTFKFSDTQLDAYIAQAQNALKSSNLASRAAEAGLTAAHVFAGFFIALFALFFFLSDGGGIWSWLVRLFPKGAREKVHSSGIIAWGQISAFTRATMAVAAVDALGIGIGAAILGVPFASGIGLLVFFGAFIPVVGAAISGGVAVLLALVALGPVKALIMLGVVIAVQQLESHILQPLLIGRAMSLHPLAVILAIAAGIVIAGIVGGLIAVPTVAVLNAVGHHLLDEDSSEGPPTEIADVLSQPEIAAAEVAVADTEERHGGHGPSGLGDHPER